MDASQFKKGSQEQEEFLAEWNGSDSNQSSPQHGARQRRPEGGRVPIARQQRRQQLAAAELVPPAQLQSAILAPGQPVVQQPAQSIIEPQRSQPVHQPVLPRPNRLAQSARQPSKVSQPQVAPDPTAAVSINIQIPALNRAQLRQARKQAAKRTADRLRTLRRSTALYKRRYAMIVALCCFIAIGVLAPSIMHHIKHGSGRGSSGGTSGGATTTTFAKPTFTVIVPASKQKLAMPDGVHSVFDAKRDSYEFSDISNSINFTVSEQPVPSGQSLDDLVATAAKGLKATTQFKAGDGTAYILTNQKYQSQTIAFGAKGLLCFIQSSGVLTQDQWTNYIATLQ